METLARWAAYLAMAGGAIFAATLIVVVISPTSPAWFGEFAGIVLLGAAVPGLYWRTRPATGRLGWATAWLSGLGTVTIGLVGILGIANGEFLTMQAQNPAMTPLLALGIAAFMALVVGNLGFAVALIRTRTLSRLGAWLILAGAVVAVATSFLYGVTVDPTLTAVITLLFGLMPVGWIVVGYAAWRQAST